jgi:hypothetical protein
LTEHSTIPLTVGQAACDLLKSPDTKQSVIDTQREMQKGYIDELVKCAKDAESRFGTSRCFYVCVQTRRERLLINVIRNQFYARFSRPFPAYDLALYHYDPKDEKLSFVWCIPDRETVEMMSQPGYVCPADQRQLYSFVQSFKKGSLI